MIKKIKELTCKALVLSMLASTVLPGFSGSAYGAYGEKLQLIPRKRSMYCQKLKAC